MSTPILTAEDRRPLLVVTAGFLVTRVYAWVAGVRFDDSPLDYFWQFADPALLEHDFFRTIWWFHAQPPAFNGFLGIVLQLPEGIREPVFATTFFVCGAVIAAATYVLADHLGVPRVGAVAVALLFAASPTAIVYEHMLFYPYPVAAVLLCTFVALERYLRTGARGWAVACFGAAGLLVLTRATFHLLWLASMAVVVLLARPESRRRTLAAVAVPLVLASGLYVKNWIQFDTFSGSSWVGMNLARVVVNELPEDERSGRLVVLPFSPPEAYGAETHEPTGVAVLDQLYKPEGEPNFNNIVYAELADSYTYHSLRNIRDHPGAYLKAVGSSVRLYFAPATDQPFVILNAEEIRGYADAFNRLALLTPDPSYFVPLTGAPDASGYAPDAKDISWLAVIAYLLALGTLPVVAFRARRRSLVEAVRGWVLATASATVWILVIAGTFGELGENSRFRVETDPLVYVLAAALLADLLRRRSNRATAATAASTASDGSAAARNRV